MKKVILAAALATTMIGCGDKEEKQAISLLKSRLYDPSSLQIESVTHHEWCGFGTADGKDLPIIKIVYNAKNRFGGYTGSSTAYYSPMTFNLNTELDGKYGAPALAYEMALDDPSLGMDDVARIACEELIDA